MVSGEELRGASEFQNDYRLNPHLSLVYQTMPREIKVEIANSVSLPFDCILFDSMKTMISPVKVETRIEVEPGAWWRTKA
jgi:hypothetical protein